MTAEKLTSEVLKLPVKERLELLEKGLESLYLSDKTDLSAWADEAEQRLAALNRGQDMSRSAEEVMKDLFGN